MNQKDQERLIKDCFDVLTSLMAAIEKVGGNPRGVVASYMDRPLSDFLTNLCLRNGVRFCVAGEPVPELADDRLDRYRDALSRINQYYDASPGGELYIAAKIAEEALR